MGKNKEIIVIGGGLAGSEAAFQIARLGFKVVLYEMRPKKFTPAHKTDLLAELVCSNSLKAFSLENASGILKEEMRILSSLIMESADKTRVPAGGSLAVDRERFSELVTRSIEMNTNIKIIREEVVELPDKEPTIIATGPLTSEGLIKNLVKLIGEKRLYFYDAIAPIVKADSIDMNIAFKASRYEDKGDGDYINCPMNKEQYYNFIKAIEEAEKIEPRDFEDVVSFERCKPIEDLIKRGPLTLAFGPMKPKGLIDPKTGNEPFAVVQLRQDNIRGDLYNMVGFQTRLKWPEQERIFRMIPGLEKVEFYRYGSLHRNTFINAPALLNETLQLKNAPHIFIAGQLTGVEGYLESTAMGLLSGIFTSIWMKRGKIIPPPKTTAIGSLLYYITHADPKNFQPMSINFGLFPPINMKGNKKERRKAIAKRALTDIKKWYEMILKIFSED